MEFFQILGDMSGLDDAIRFIFLVVFLTLLVTHIIVNLGLCFTFKKAGKSGVAAFVPIYNTYILCQITGVNTYWVPIYYCTLFIPVLSFIVTVYFRILLSFSAAKSFDKSEIWGVGLLLAGPIFYLILGLGGSRYLGPKPMNDVIFKGNRKENYNSNEYQYGTIQQSGACHYCTSCGTEVIQGNQYCHNCGKRIL